MSAVLASGCYNTKLEVIKQWLKKIAGFDEVTEVEPHLPQSKSFLKVLDIPY